MALQLRPYQEDAIERARDCVRRGKKRFILCAPVGAGKTVIFSHLILSALERGKRVLVTAHRRELCRQPFCKLVRYGVDPAQIGIIMASVGLPTRNAPPVVTDATDGRIWFAHARRRPNAPVQIASTDSLRNREKPAADLVIIDEAHRTLAKSNMDMLACYPDATVVGLTATPTRGDGRGLGEAYEELIVVANYSELSELGFLVMPRVFTTPNLPDVSRVSIVKGEFDQAQLAEACDKDGLIGDVIDHWKRRGNDAATIVFAASVEHSKHIAARFNEAGITAAHLDGEMKVSDRDRIIEDLATGRVKVVVNMDVLSEGTDIPVVKCVVSCRPTQSERLLIQQCGRGSRPCQACEGCEVRGRCERKFVILDHAGNVARHGLPQADREWTLLPREKKRGASVGGPLVWICSCQTCNPLTETSCLECGKERPAAKERAELVEHDGELVEVAPLTDDQKRVAWFKVVADWVDRNAGRACPLKPEWCSYRFRDLYGCLPPAGCSLPRWSDQERSRRADFEKDKERGGQKMAWAWGAKKLEEAQAEEEGRRILGFDPPVRLGGDERTRAAE